MRTADEVREKEAAKGRGIIGASERVQRATGIKFARGFTIARDSYYVVKAAQDNAGQARQAAEGKVAEIDQARRTGDAVAMVEHARKAKDFDGFTLPEDGLAEAQAEEAAALRIFQAAQIAAKTAAFEVTTEALRPEFAEKLAETWAETIGWEPKQSTTYAEIQSRGAVSEQILAEIAGLTVKLAEVDGANREEIKRLRAALKARPTVLPTLKDIEHAMTSEQENTPHARAIRAAAEAKAAKAERDRESATVGARARQGELT